MIVYSIYDHSGNFQFNGIYETYEEAKKVLMEVLDKYQFELPEEELQDIQIQETEI